MKTKLILAGVTALFMSTNVSAQSWSLLGNSGTTDGTNFLGTTDNVPLTFLVNGRIAGRVDHLLDNALFGSNAGNLGISGNANSAFGSKALISNTSGTGNSAFGYLALSGNTSGANNSAFGIYALNSNTNGSENCAFGDLSLPNNTTGFNNCSMGYASLVANSTGFENVAIGANCLSVNTSGYANIAIGASALDLNFTGAYNSAFGVFANVNNFSYSNATALGAFAVASSSNKVRIGNTTVTVIEGQPAFYTSSDGRFKTNLSEDDVKGLDFIKRLRPVVYNFDTKKFEDFLSKNMPDSIRKKHLDQDFTKSTNLRRTGFIAQEVEKAAKEANFNFDGVHAPVDENDNYSLAYGEFVVPLVKAMQEQQAMIEKMELKMQEQDKVISELRKQNTSTGINDNSGTLNNFFMGQNEPNPFTHETVIRYALPANTHNAYLAVYDLSGKQITDFVINETNSKAMTITSEKLPAGIYIYSIVCDGKILDSKRMIVAGK